MLKRISFFIILILLLLTFIFCTSLAYYTNKPQIQINNIKYKFYTIGIEADPLFQKTPLVQGEELENWADPRFLADCQPNVFDITLLVENKSKSIISSDLLVEFWISKAKIIDDEDGAMDIDKMRAKVKWSKLWEKKIHLNELKANEKRELVIERIKIVEIEKNLPKDLALMGWNCKVTHDKFYFEKPFKVNYLY